MSTGLIRDVAGSVSLQYLALAAGAAALVGTVLMSLTEGSAEAASHLFDAAFGLAPGEDTGPTKESDHASALGLPSAPTATRSESGIVLVNGVEKEVTFGMVNCLGFNQSECKYYAFNGDVWELQRTDSGEYARDERGNYIVAGRNPVFKDGELHWEFPDGLVDGKFRPLSGPPGEPIDVIDELLGLFLSDADPEGSVVRVAAGADLVDWLSRTELLRNREGLGREDVARIREQLAIATEEAVAQAEAEGRQWKSQHLNAFRRGWLVANVDRDFPDDEQAIFTVDVDLSKVRRAQFKGEDWPRDVAEAYLLGRSSNGDYYGFDGPEDVFDPDGPLAPEMAIEQELRHAGANYNAEDSEYLVFPGDVVGKYMSPLQDREEVHDALMSGNGVTVVEKDATPESTGDWRSDRFLAGVYLGPESSTDADDGWVKLTGPDSASSSVEVPTQDWNRWVGDHHENGRPVPLDRDETDQRLYANARPLETERRESNEPQRSDNTSSWIAEPSATDPPPLTAETAGTSATPTEASPAAPPTPAARPEVWDPDDPSRPNPNDIWDEVVRGSSRSRETPALLENTGPTFVDDEKNAEQTRVLRPGAEPGIVIRNTDIEVTAGHVPSRGESDTSSNRVNRRFGVGDDDREGPVYTGEHVRRGAGRVIGLFGRVFGWLSPSDDAPHIRKTRPGEVPFDERGTASNPCVSPNGCRD